MTFFESLIALLLVAILLLQVSRRLGIPYPTMLAAAGVGLAWVPGAPEIGLDPHMALALFIAPALVDAAFDFPLSAIRMLWRPLLALAVVAVLLTAGVVAWVGVEMAGLPLYAALALGAIVAPPDAAAATAILRTVTMPRRSVMVLKGESLLNDATALLLFTGAVMFHRHETGTAEFALRLGLAAPGGVLLGVVWALVLRRVVTPFVRGTLGGHLLEFVGTFGAWIVAERLGLSAVLCVVAMAMTLAHTSSLDTPPRSRIHSYAVWGTVVFLLNVLAFLLMGFQARSIVEAMPPAQLAAAARFAGAVVLCVIGVRMAWVLVFNRLAAYFRAMRGSLDIPSLKLGVLVGWSGMRGLVTVATALALPASFPSRDLIVLTAFAVVLATLVLQGLTLGPLVRWLGLDGEDGLDDEIGQARAEMAAEAVASLDGQSGRLVEHWRAAFETRRAAALARDGAEAGAIEEKRRLGLAAMRRQRACLDTMRKAGRVGPDAFLVLQEELDFAEISMTDEAERQIEEG